MGTKFVHSMKKKIRHYINGHCMHMYQILWYKMSDHDLVHQRKTDDFIRSIEAQQESCTASIMYPNVFRLTSCMYANDYTSDSEFPHNNIISYF